MTAQRFEHGGNGGYERGETRESKKNWDDVEANWV